MSNIFCKNFLHGKIIRKKLANFLWHEIQISRDTSLTMREGLSSEIVCYFQCLHQSKNFGHRNLNTQIWRVGNNSTEFCDQLKLYNGSVFSLCISIPVVPLK